MTTYETYLDLIKMLTERYSIRQEIEHKFIHEMFEAEIPLFKLIFAYNDKTKVNSILLSFHIDSAALDAVLWYSRIYNMYPGVKLTDSYMKDSRGETFLGQDAEVLRRYKLEQEILGDWSGTKEEAAEFAKAPVRRKRPKSSQLVTKDKALEEFNQMVSGDDDEYH